MEHFFDLKVAEMSSFASSPAKPTEYQGTELKYIHFLLNIVLAKLQRTVFSLLVLEEEELC